ncbi:MAG: tRNA (guanosine(46)-N7)-methyltransferase TrmB [Lachnospiraceae bacterium]|nr:tRNA (guanosine(46)-N7)-methyltransferase TrmB [Lachnospiraceae bacterium]
MRLRNVPGSREAIAESRFVIQKPEEYRGKWKEVFVNDHPLHIEVGMGKGRFLMDLAAQNPEINYVGIEMYSSVLLRAVQKAEQDFNEMSNFRLIRMDARDLMAVFEKDEVQRIYLNFSDPWPKDRHAKRRLTSVQFMARYEGILDEAGWVEFKTDNKDLFAFSLESVKEKGWILDASTWDLHHNEVMNVGNIMTEYEERFSSQGNPICKLIARPDWNLIRAEKENAK